MRAKILLIDDYAFDPRLNVKIVSKDNIFLFYFQLGCAHAIYTRYIFLPRIPDKTYAYSAYCRWVQRP